MGHSGDRRGRPDRRIDWVSPPTARLARTIIGIGRNAHRLARARQLGAIDEAATQLELGVAKAELTILCTPVETIAGFARQVAAHCPASSLITDAGSTKQSIVEQLQDRWPADRAVFVGSHPLAGSEKTGVDHADGQLLVGRTVVITPTDQTPPGARQRIEEFWRDLGATVLAMTPAEHDRAVAAISHLPHVIASLTAAVTPERYLPLAATGWLDTTRVAAGDVELWRQILFQNRPRVLHCLDEFAKVLNSFTEALQQEDEPGRGATSRSRKAAT